MTDFLPMPADARERLITEHQELGNRMAKLAAFIASDTFTRFPLEDRTQLYSQLQVQASLHSILLHRRERDSYRRGDSE